MNRHQIDRDLWDAREVINDVQNIFCFKPDEPDPKTTEIALDAIKRAINRLDNVAEELGKKADENE